MSLGKKLFIGGGTACTTDTADVFGDGSGVALYTLDYDASDASGNYNGSTNSNVTFGVEGRINTAADFTGGGVATIPNNVISGNNHSVSIWFKLDNTSGYQNIFDFDYNNRIMFRAASSDANEANIGTSGWFAHNINFSANLWYHLVITFSNGNPFKIYVNGSIAYTGGNSSLNAQLGDNNFGAGNAAGTHSINGKIDQLRIFNKELSATEVSALYGETACVYTSTTDIVGFPSSASSNLFAYYKLDNTGNDESANGHDGTPGSSMAYSFGRFGTGGSFDGSNNAVITIPDSNKFSPSVNDFSVSFWFNTSSTTTNRLIAKGSNPYEWEIWVSNGQPVYASYQSAGANHGVLYGGSSPGIYADGNWHHLVVTHDHLTEAEIFLDNVSLNSLTSFTGSMSNTNSTVTIGKRGDQSSSLTGKLDQIRFYDKILTTDEIAELYNEKPEAELDFNIALYTGSGTANRYVSNVGFQPDLVWLKQRSAPASNFWFDSVRGASNWLASDLDFAENSASGVSSFEANGFDLGTNGSMNGLNKTYVAWCWKGGGDAVQNNDGTLTSQVSANPDAGFSIVKWTNNGAVRTVGHGLNSTPELIIFKRTDTSQNWYVETDVIDGSYDYLVLNDGSSAKVDGSGAWSTRATSSTITSFTSITNSEYIAYCFHSVTGYQKIGSYTGGGSSGKTVTTGFRPRWVMIRRTDVGNYWVIIDSVRDTSDPYGQILYANVYDQEGSGGATTSISFSNTGFSMSTSAVGGSINASGGTYIYLAIA